MVAGELLAPGEAAVLRVAARVALRMGSVMRVGWKLTQITLIAPTMKHTVCSR